ncbi:MAG: hypothetical protein QXN79_05215, partial [Zestosphaera sp.]
ESLKKSISGWGVIPKFKMEEEPRVWRGSPRLGQDARLILSRLLDYTADEVEELIKSNDVCCE